MRAQFSATRESAMRLAMAHVDLAKAEFSAIGGEIARAAALIGLAVAVLMLAGILVVVGTALFTAEWLLGSMGWGVLHGILIFAGIATAAVVAALGMPAATIGRRFGLALLIGVAASVALGLDAPNRAYTALGDITLATVEPGVRPLVTGILTGAVLGLLLGIALAFRLTSSMSRFTGIVGLALAGAALGAFTAITFGPQVGVGIGSALGWASWIALLAAALARTGIDADALKARFYPHRTIETSKETLAWLQSKMPPGIGS